MVAVAALLAALDGTATLDRVAIATTRWVAQDPAADVTGLAREVWPELPLLAANLDFSRSRHPALHAYERFLVKEGVGAGGACVAALLTTGASIEQLQAAIDDAYDEVLAG
jgi:NaMN:DMB phosphoribosyltransferase